MFPATATGLVIPRDLSSWEREEGKPGGEGRQGEEPLPIPVLLPALSSTFRAVGCQATMPTLLEWPSSTTTGSVRDRVSPFSGICHTWEGQERKGKVLRQGQPLCRARGSAASRSHQRCHFLCKQEENQGGNQGGNHSQLSINPWLIHGEHPSSLMGQHKPTAPHGAASVFPCPWTHSIPAPQGGWKISPAAPIPWKELLSFQTMPVLLQLYYCLLLITLRTPAIHFPVRFRILPDPI